MWRVAKATDEVSKYCAIAATMQKQEDAGELSAAQKKTGNDENLSPVIELGLYYICMHGNKFSKFDGTKVVAPANMKDCML